MEDQILSRSERGPRLTKILLVEDDPDLLDLTAYVLRRERFVVIPASDGAQALERWKNNRPDVVILDLGIPAPDGFEVLRRIREQDQTPVLVVTGRKEARDILRCFNLGSDDFVPKPFEYRELTARVRAILRRANAAKADVTEPTLQLDSLTLDPVGYEVTWRNEPLRLTPTEFRILYLLVTNAGNVVPASRLYTYVWGSEGADANALRSHMTHVRRKLEIDGGSPGTISSIPRVGYVFKRTPRSEGTATAELGVASPSFGVTTPELSVTPPLIVAPQDAGSAA
jgi:DNA-binding response OmpR family regulator